jgi:hypothetical protein
MSDEFDILDASEKAAVERALNRCRVLARQIESELRDKRPEHFVDKVSLADLCASLERAADVLGQKSRQSVKNTPAPAMKDPRARGRPMDVAIVVMAAGWRPVVATWSCELGRWIEHQDADPSPVPLSFEPTHWAAWVPPTRNIDTWSPQCLS